MDNQSNLFTSTAVAVLQALPQVKHKQFSDIGINAELYGLLCDLTSKELSVISKKANNYLLIQIDALQLKAEIIDLIKKRKDSDLQDTYILNHATGRIMHDFFGTHQTEFVARRRELGMNGVGKQRPRLADEKEEHIIWRAWLKYEEMEERLRYLRIAEETSIPLSVIYPAIEQHKDFMSKEM